jgi:hypothetical protein
MSTEDLDLPDGVAYTFVDSADAETNENFQTAEKHVVTPEARAIIANTTDSKQQIVAEETFIASVHQFVVFMRKAWPRCEELQNYEDKLDMLSVVPVTYAKRRKHARIVVVELHIAVRDLYDDVAAGNIEGLLHLDHDLMKKTRLQNKWIAINKRDPPPEEGEEEDPETEAKPKPKSNYERYAGLRAGITSRIQMIFKLVRRCVGAADPKNTAAGKRGVLAEGGGADGQSDDAQDVPSAAASATSSGDTKYVKADLFIAAVVQLVDVMSVAWKDCKKLKAFQATVHAIVKLPPGDANRIAKAENMLESFYDKASRHFIAVADGNLQDLTLTKHPIITSTNFRKKWAAINRKATAAKYKELRAKIVAYVQNMCNLANSVKSMESLPDDIKMSLMQSVKDGMGPDGEMNAAAVFGSTVENFMNMDPKRKIQLAKKFRKKHNKKTAMGMMKSSLQMARQMGCMGKQNPITPQQMQQAHEKMREQVERYKRGEGMKLPPEIESATSVE